MPRSLKESSSKIAREIKLITDEKATRQSAATKLETSPDIDPQKLNEEKAAEWIADRLVDKRAEWIADVDAHAGSVSPTVEQPLTAAEQSLGLGQANTPGSANYVMQKKPFQMFRLPPVDVAITRQRISSQPISVAYGAYSNPPLTWIRSPTGYIIRSDDHDTYTGRNRCVSKKATSHGGWGSRG